MKYVRQGVLSSLSRHRRRAKQSRKLQQIQDRHRLRYPPNYPGESWQGMCKVSGDPTGPILSRVNFFLLDTGRGRILPQQLLHHEAGKNRLSTLKTLSIYDHLQKYP